MLVDIAKKQRPSMKPEDLVEKLIKQQYSNTK